MEKEKSNSTVRVILNVPDDLNETFVKLSEKRGLKKSQMMIFALSWFVDYNKSMDMMPKMVDFLSNPDVMKEIIKE